MLLIKVIVVLVVIALVVVPVTLAILPHLVRSGARRYVDMERAAGQRLLHLSKHRRYLLCSP